MNETNVRKTYKEKLRPTPAQERALDEVLWRCRTLYNAALEQRITAWERCHVSVTRSQQEAELKAIRAEFPEYAALHSHVLQDVLARLDKTYQAFFRRVATGEQARVSRASRGAPAGTPSPTRSTATALGWRTALSSCRRSGASPCAGPARLKGPSRPSLSPARPMGGTSASRAPRCPRSRCRCTGKETGIDVGLQGVPHHGGRRRRREPAPLPQGRARAARRRSSGCPAARRGAIAARRRWRCAPSNTSTSAGSAADFHHKTALALVRRYDTIYVEAIQAANLSRRPAPMPDGHGGYLQNGASRKAGLNKSIHDAGWGRLPVHPRLQGSMGRQASGSGPPGVYLAGL